MAKRKNFTGDLFAPDEEFSLPAGGGLAEAPAQTSTPKNPETAHTIHTTPAEQLLADEPDPADAVAEEAPAGMPPGEPTDEAAQALGASAPDPAPLKRRSALKKEETKSKRLNLLIRPGVLKEFAKIAYMRHTSVNDLINRLISEHNAHEADTIRQYDRLFKERR